MNYGRSTFREAGSQEETLRMLAELVERATVNPLIVNTARMITQDCGNIGGARTQADDLCELKAIYRAVKTGDSRVAPLKRGFKYIADPRFADYFSSPVDSLQNCLKGACAGDCDDHAALLCSLAGAIGFRCALRAWGPKDERGFSHVYALAGFPKRNPQRWIPMDTTVASATLGWQPPRGNVMDAIFE